MRYITDRKRAVGKGASGTGTAHHWAMQVSAVALALMIPAWLYVFGSALGGTQAEVLATFGRPLPAILTALVLVVGMKHFASGAQMMIEDYVQGSARKVAVILVTCLAWAIAATGLFALVRMAL
ncbi:succinate dehydrogenase, hydrophobic membrane anchor protein [Pseudorhodobacter sp. MZDSW-24AT]|uniref:succinate dehydrogenase, hydrophobic membrane anchor protein n=1 Tax=Pseudorhodobacter sp. MZDSW-24AT TaxID=2052957 RepID=UPI000C1F2E6D|nr:succinate dehydrogenase, hydrophobic membrane anchor protein [Pseudorhodobacter sp. MZDSW-24AT]PJF07872.1 succinate dehydrogenase, hydrophobic membrane anchor protein [Pseudorhodobacter sp. MZDSW-24AT]